mmetsp:Transcript_32121/g.68383  ORF Transcript_32121/g.68383 Transcript_32121/m.68383 type:complete len:128 (-) Transcript_32121:136-519(-)
MSLVRPVVAKELDRASMTTETIIVPERDPCAYCNGKEAHDFCNGCHHWFHVSPHRLPSNKQKLIALPTGKRTADNEPKYMFVQNDRAHLWHVNARQNEKAGSNAPQENHLHKYRVEVAREITPRNRT